MLDLDLDADGKITSFSGPIYAGYVRSITPEGRATALVPSAFFKVVCFINKKTKKLDVRTFIVWQDRDALADKTERQVFNNQTYQVTVSEIEEKTGLVFPHEVYDQNPLLYRENEEKKQTYNISHFPERIEVDSPGEIVSSDEKRTYFADEEVGVYLAAAMINPTGRESDEEWVSIINLTPGEVNLEGWKLTDKENRELVLKKTCWDRARQ